MHVGSRALAAGAAFRLLPPHDTMLTREARRRGLRGAHRLRQEPDDPARCAAPPRRRQARRRPPAPDALRRPASRPSSASRATRTSTPPTARSRSARSTSRTSPRGTSSSPASTMRRSCEAAEERRTWWSGTAATTTRRSQAPTCTSSSSIRTGPGTSSATTRARRTCGWPTSASSTRWTARRRKGSTQFSASIRAQRSGRPRSSSPPRRSTIEGEADEILGKRVLAIEDGPTLTHGEMTYGAAVLAARQTARPSSSTRARSPSARSRRRSEDPNVGALLPAMGYGPQADG